MGDRANVKFIDGDNPPVYFYTHYDGYDLLNILQNAMRRGRDRWNDGQYLARIIFSEMIKDSVLDKTGYGISTYIGDNNYPIIVVNVEERIIYLLHESGGQISKSYNFHDFIFAEDVKDLFPEYFE